MTRIFRPKPGYSGQDPVISGQYPAIPAKTRLYPVKNRIVRPKSVSLGLRVGKLFLLLFTVTGVVNNFLTVAINVLIWDKHACLFGLFCLLVMIAGVSSTSAQRHPAASKLMDSKYDGDDYSEEKRVEAFLCLY
ncbi:sugar transporter [Artemisia annua]|uniref:Sugar transporter n=1 Tax=Artemisia annua TaxID=35608 RepID=A0A2U1M0C5_ARTAN|nr:sugar transporter [Artemisia annua]